jgi:transmembrane sensor
MVFRFLQKLRLPHRIRREQIDTEDTLKGILERDFEVVRRNDAETRVQWLRLQRALSTPTHETRPTRTRLVPRLAFGAAIAAAIVGAYFYFIPRELAPETFATRKGEQTRLVLHDSSEVTLNYATQLTVPQMQSGKARLLLLKGEAFFRVRRNETPFIVSTEYADVQVIGTEFNVYAREGMLEVAVIRGIVNVKGMNTPSENALTLTQGQRAICERAKTPRLIHNIPSVEYPGWMHGKLFFEKATFAEACREIEMRFNVAIRIADGNVRNELVTGLLNAKSAESALTALCGLTGKQFRRDGHEYRIY